MSINLSVKGVPEAVADALRERAARNHRSLQGELMAIIERAAAEPAWPVGAGGIGAGAAPARSGVVHRGTKTIEEIAAEHRLRFPHPITVGPMAVDIIRADRDSR